MLVLPLALGLGACQDGEPAPPTVTVTETQTAEDLGRPEQQQLSEARAKAAMPTLKDLPTGYHVDTTVFSDKRRRTDPAGCIDLYMEGDAAHDFDDQHKKASSQARFGRYAGGGKDIVAVYLDSYDAPVPLELFDQAGAAVGECASFTSGSSPTYTAEGIAVRDLGERTFAVRLTGGGVSVDRLYVRSGHNLLVVIVLSQAEKFDEELMGSLAEQVLERAATGRR